MAVPGKRKAALLLMSLDSATAAELLRGAPPEAVRDLAAEVAQIDADGRGAADLSEIAREFREIVSGQAKTGGLALLGQLLQQTMGDERAREVLDDAQEQLFRRDPFQDIRRATPHALAGALADESPHIAALVLAELPEATSTKLLGLLPPPARTEAIRGLVGGGEVSPDARARVAKVLIGKLAALSPEQEGAATDELDPRQRKLRKVAVLLRQQEPEVRDDLLQGVASENTALADEIRSLMVLWEDVAIVADRPLQEVLRGINSRKLALALTGADPAIMDKVRRNVSERAAGMLDEETQLLSSPKPAEVRDVREEILLDLRERNERGELAFVGGG